MSTNSAIAIPQDNGFKGRYCHWDGYPTHIAAELLRIVAEHGVERARAILVEENCGWSALDATPALGRGYTDGRFKVVEGVGVAFNAESGQGSFDEWVTPKQPDVPWVYILNDNALSVMELTYPSCVYEHRGDVEYGEVAPERLVALECGEKFERCQHYAWAHGAPRDWTLSTAEWFAFTRV